MAMLGKRRPARTSSKPTTRTAPRRQEAGSDGAALTIQRLSHDGRGVSRDGDGKTVFVDDALPGEVVEIAVHRRRQRFDEAHVRHRRHSSAERAVPACPHYGRCGGCDLQHLAVDAQRAHKRSVLVDQLERHGIELGVAVDVLAGAPLGYRRRARLGVRLDSRGHCHLGFRARGSHHLVDIDQCPILVPELGELLTPLRDLLASLEAVRRVGHIELLAGDDSRVVVVRQLRDNPADARRWREWGEAHGVHVVWQVGRDQPQWRWLGKPGTLRYTLKGGARDVVVGFEPGDFLQVNAEVNRQLVSTARDWLALRGEERIVDLFAGVGNFTLALAGEAGAVLALEGSPAMVSRLRDNAAANGLHHVEARQVDLTRSPGFGGEIDVVVLDPPREGAEAACLDLAASRVPRILYVACDPATLARDAARLVHAGYRIRRAAVADMFVQTAHLESMLLFERER
ncbi:methyltransferase domain-containing protein [Modicisalibacter coralii]|uniref:methyltransferase domain-containing protein n=1 Tax=Modicisalibacter coralii TaxID=2304602 RepID=UPI00100B22A8|nr:methyltransferase domain-containing protein [Halomonas coralii]